MNFIINLQSFEFLILLELEVYDKKRINIEGTKKEHLIFKGRIKENSKKKTNGKENFEGVATPLYQSQCVLHKHELLICGGLNKRACYSYHTLKNEYKFICEYPSGVELWGHCVVKLVDNNSNNDKGHNLITLLSFGGDDEYARHTLVMKYVSFWSDDNNNNGERQINQIITMNGFLSQTITIIQFSLEEMMIMLERVH
ncbi:hypothetical protein RFI_01612 [Reticulomyxa filosa]|uniref:Uncharacterized protein n=1 Tax=Reticulomyxa filosa TaxID=46433 RepID=X6PCR5_RETFI|nr:hypothetical protein RFI_01612 [Reticulomyxa filosa]|eukprot:ETO35452.1 hypothetical protein RFI_01612 [Reticulomyxa filosa]